MTTGWRQAAGAVALLVSLAVAPAAAATGASPLERAWRGPSDSLLERVTRTRGQALQQGVWNLDPAARAALARGFPGDAVTRAEAAVALAPDLPAAHMARARARYLVGGSLLGGVRSAIDALRAIPRHPEAAFWFGGSALVVLAAALVAGGLLAIGVAAAWVAPHASHDLGDRVAAEMPPPARAALLAGLLLLPLALGEGLLGLGAALGVPAAAYAGRRQRGVLAVAAALVVAGAWPVARVAGATLAAFSSDPVAEVALASSQSGVSVSDAARVAWAGEGDRLAERVLARHARRAGLMEAADARYLRLLEDAPVDAALVNNAANVRLELGHMEAALELYDRAARLEASPVVLFNLSQAHGRAFRVEELTAALERAQSLDAPLVSELTSLQGVRPEGFVVDLPIPLPVVWERARDGEAGAVFAAGFREWLAPGWLGGSPLRAGLAFALAGLGGGLGALRFRRSRHCPRCGARLCPRCDDPPGRGGICEACTQIFQRPETTDRVLRLSRLAALRDRERRLARVAGVVACAVPGAAGLLAGGPVRSLVGAVLACLAVFAVAHRHGVVPDPLVAGAAAPLAFGLLAAFGLLGHLALAALAVAGRRGG